MSAEPLSLTRINTERTAPVVRPVVTTLLLATTFLCAPDVSGQERPEPAQPQPVLPAPPPTPQPVPTSSATLNEAAYAELNGAPDGDFSQTIRDSVSVASSAFVAVFTGVLVLVSCLQWRATRDSARAALRSADVAEKALKDLNRAWLHAGEWRLHDTFPHLLVEFSVYNYGRTPATLIDRRVEYAVNRTVRLTADEPDLLHKDTDVQEMRSVQLVPGQSHSVPTLVANLSLKEAPWPGLRQQYEDGPGLMAHVRAHIRYLDAFGEKRELQASCSVLWWTRKGTASVSPAGNWESALARVDSGRDIDGNERPAG